MFFSKTLRSKTKHSRTKKINESKTKIANDIFKAIHQRKWLYLEYKNKQENITRYWFGIENIDVKRESLSGKGLHLSFYTIKEITIYIANIRASKVIDATYIAVNTKLIEDIQTNPGKYDFLFSKSADLKVLNYLSDCEKLEGTPSLNRDFHLIESFDDQTIKSNQDFCLSEGQFRQITEYFCHQIGKMSSVGKNSFQLCLNILSVHTKKGLYVLAYKELLFDVEKRTLRQNNEVIFNKTFEFSEEKNERIVTENINRFINADEFYLLEDFEKNAEDIKNLLQKRIKESEKIDDCPYFLCLNRAVNVDLDKEYESILKMYETKKVTVPVQAFFGELKSVEPEKEARPIFVSDKFVNLDQLLAIYNAMNFPVTYVQGPPGTGKTKTIINTIITAFFNEKTVLFSSFNNHPIDTVVKELTSLKYFPEKHDFKTNHFSSENQIKSETIPFPILRLGNNQKVKDALNYIRELYQRVKNLPVYDEASLSKNKEEQIEKTKKLVALLKKHQEIVNLQERKQTLEALISQSENMELLVFEGNQLSQIKKKLEEIGTVTDEDALDLLKSNDKSELEKYLFFKSAARIKKLDEPEFAGFLEILFEQNEEKRLSLFNRFLTVQNNLHLLKKVFPVICTTCISSHKLANEAPDFDITIIDEASQCDLALSLVPIIRGKTLMLVGDPQQLNPVITLDPSINRSLKNKYSVGDNYDYIANSIYKSFLANDSVSDEILLRTHYRCAKPIIDFSNKKYYNNLLNIRSKNPGKNPLVLSEIKSQKVLERNTSLEECDAIVSYIKRNSKENIGIITPFKNQKSLIESAVYENITDAEKYQVGTIHAFQGDEKDTILLSLAVTDQTNPKTYDWVRNNRELINVATSRAKNKLVLFTDGKAIDNFHKKLPDKNDDDLFELVEYVKKNGKYKVTKRENSSRALGTKPYETETERAFLTTLNHALSNIFANQAEGKKSRKKTGNKYKVKREVQLSHVFDAEFLRDFDSDIKDYFFRSSFDFVIYKEEYKDRYLPLLAIELNGREHYENKAAVLKDEKKRKICEKYNFKLISVQNSYARRYNHIKQILADFFENPEKN